MRIRRPWLLVSAACVVPAALDGLQIYLQGRVVGHPPPEWQEVFWQASEWLILGALTPLTFYLGRRFPIRRPYVGRHLAVHIAGALVLCAGWAAAGAGLRWLLGTSPRDVSTGRYLASWVLTSLPWSVFMYFAVLGCVHAFSFFLEAREREAQAARLSAQLAEARLGALRMQLNPHFLFNSLNAITVLVRDQDTNAATRMLELLSEALRQALRDDQGIEVPLAQELYFLEQYLAIEQVRFSDRLRPAVMVDASLHDAAVPGFILQPLVENAIRHGIAQRSGAGLLEIGARLDDGVLVLTVRDDGPGPRTPLAARQGLGLANTRERLATMYGSRASLTLARGEEGGAIATIRLPYHVLAATPESLTDQPASAHD